ncbi:MAG: CHAD domain-containing protein [Actinomycetota bacterium]
MTTTHREVERKLRVGDAFEIPDLADRCPSVSTVEAGTPVVMHATYYDTPDLRLFRWRVTLRRRTGGGDAGWHLKLPVEGADSGTRDEVRMPDAGGGVPDEIRALVSALTRDAELQPIVSLRTHRTPSLLRDADGRARAELVDDRVSVIDGPRTVMDFREIEVESLADADEPMLDEVVGALAERGAVPSTMSKAATALGPRTLAPPDIPELAWPSPHDPAADAVRAYLCLHARRLILQDVRVRRDLPDAVHQLRVAARRLRSGLRVFRPLIDREWADRLRGELAWAASGLGTARDSEVLLERLDTAIDSLGQPDASTARSVVDPALQGRVDQGRREVAQTLDSPRYATFLVDLVEAAAAPRWTASARETCDHALPPLARKAFRRLARDVKALTADSTGAQWHETRIAAKRARYAAEAIAPVFPERMDDLAHGLSAITDILGDQQDADVARQLLRALSESATPGQAFALGRVDERQVSDQALDREAFAQTWPRVHRMATKAHLS